MAVDRPAPGLRAIENQAAFDLPYVGKMTLVPLGIAAILELGRAPATRRGVADVFT